MADWLLDRQYRFNGHRIHYAVHGDGPTPRITAACAAVAGRAEAIVAALLRFLPLHHSP
ncbi:hypothetical protein [Pseudomonas brassicacearum]|uniref:hypothetical protein n=1 Tax=Pseudomonas brassicacearum TaxID=930166 RepID=UPI00160C88AC|nr:hypothetical protein [Pseudomonas brassicacearum]